MVVCYQLLPLVWGERCEAAVVCWTRPGSRGGVLDTPSQPRWCVGHALAVEVVCWTRPGSRGGVLDTPSQPRWCVGHALTAEVVCWTRPDNVCRWTLVSVPTQGPAFSGCIGSERDGWASVEEYAVRAGPVVQSWKSGSGFQDSRKTVVVSMEIG